MESSRKRKSLKNIIFALFSNVFIYCLSLFTSKIIKEKLGLEILGLNGVLSNVISILSVSEMGIGSAITFALYKPLVNNDEEAIKSLMQFYKKAYRIIAFIVFVIGGCLLHFVPYFAGETTLSNKYIYLVYSLFLINSIISYLLVYKRTLIVADQKNYIISTITLISTYILKLGQLLIVFFTSSYVLYLLIQIFVTLCYNITISFICNKLYPYLQTNAQKLPKEIFTMVLQKIKAMFFHTIGSVVVTGTDNILISFFCGIEIAGKYTSYYSVIIILTNILYMIFDNIRDSVGNFLVTETTDDKYRLFKRLYFVNQSIVTIFSICTVFLITPFITVWLGSDVVLDNSVVLAIVISFYLNKNNIFISDMRSAAGLFEKDKYVPVIESIVNLVASILLAKQFGLIGIILGTIISTIIGPFWVKPLIVYKYIFDNKLKSFFLLYLTYFIRAIGLYFITYYFVNKICIFPITSMILFFIKAFILFMFVSTIWFISFCYKDEEKYFISLLLSKIRKS